jgi:TRAP-type C4-dicarboxylate transport system substrate-binding protein
VYEVAPELTRVGIGSMYFGGIAANEDFFKGLPEPVQAAFRDAAKVTSVAHGDYVSELSERAMVEMQAAGLTVHDLPDSEKTAWVDGLPDIVAPWLEQTGEAGKVVLSAYFDALRARGATPLRNWDEGR